MKAYDRVIATVPGLERKGATMPYTSVNGNMFSFLADTGVLALRLSASERTDFLEAYDTTPHVAHGRPMKEYVSVPAAAARHAGADPLVRGKLDVRSRPEAEGHHEEDRLTPALGRDGPGA